MVLFKVIKNFTANYIYSKAIQPPHPKVLKMGGIILFDLYMKNNYQDIRKKLIFTNNNNNSTLKIY